MAGYGNVLLLLTALAAACRSVGAASDTYGRYDYDRYGYKVYTYCYDRLSRIQDDCRQYSGYGRDNYYDSPTPRPSGGSSSAVDQSAGTPYRDDYYYNGRGRSDVNIGRGRFALFGRDAELTCEFPLGSQIISNIIWEKEGDRYNSIEDLLGRRMEVRRIGTYGSVLRIKDWDERDNGVYRCVASRSYNTYSRYGDKETVYMEVDFYPRERSGVYSSYRNYDDYFSGGGGVGSSYYPYYRTAAATAEEDNAVTDEKNEEKTTKS